MVPLRGGVVVVVMLLRSWRILPALVGLQQMPSLCMEDSKQG